MMQLSPDDEQRARETLKVLSDLKEKSEILSEHVENRKAALEEEIEESLHEAISNARDSLERIQENVEPKLEKVVQERLDVIKRQMEDWKEEARNYVKDEIGQQSDALNQKLLDDLDERIQAKSQQAWDALRARVQTQISEEIGTAFQVMEGKIEKLENSFAGLRGLAIAGVVLAALALGVALFFGLR